MLDIKYIIANYDKVVEALVNRGQKKEAAEYGLNLTLKYNKDRKYYQREIDAFNAAIKSNAKSEKSPGEKKLQGIHLKERKAEREKYFKEYNDLFLDMILSFPNIPHPDCPVGSEENNRIVRVVGTPTERDSIDQAEICEKLNLVDFKRGAKISGAGFPLYTRGAFLVRGLINYFLSVQTEAHGYQEVMPPLLVNEKTMIGTGQLPKFKDDMYHCKLDDLYLIPTAEVPVTNIHANEILDEKQLPLAYCAYTPCFRREAGSYGKDSRGLMRLHQFNKVELVRFCKPEDSEKEHEIILSHAEKILQELNLTYRVVELATGDLGFSAHRCYDLEVWAPASKKWLEVSSVSNFLNFQARRANIKFRRKGKKAEYVHTLNASGLAVPRVLIALLEEYYTHDMIVIPDILREFCGGRTSIGNV